MSLTDKICSETEPEKKNIKLSDGGGLQLWIAPLGGRTWRLAYRYAGRQKNLPIGSYPAVSIEEAREAAAEAKITLSKGIDPSIEKRRQKQAEEAKLFPVIIHETV